MSHPTPGMAHLPDLRAENLREVDARVTAVEQHENDQ